MRPNGFAVVSCLLSLLTTVTGAVGQAQSYCVGDCNRDCRVTIDELMGGICLHLAASPTCRFCDAYDANCNGSIAINELIQGVNNLLGGCPPDCTPGLEPACGTPTLAIPTATPSPTATGSPVATERPTPDPVADALEQALADDSRCNQLWISPSVDHLTVHCAYGPGHDADISFSRLDNVAAAAAAVAAAAPNGGALEFAGAPAYLWEEQFPSGGLEFNYRYLRAQLGCWYIAGESFDDTLYRLAYHPLELAAAIAESVGEELLDRCPAE